MTKLKHQILTKIHESIPTSTVNRSDFYKKTRKINIYKRNIDELIAAGLIEQRTGSDTLKITKFGIAALEAANDERMKFRKESVRYWITTGIALLALVISVIALAAQLGLLRLQ